MVRLRSFSGPASLPGKLALLVALNEYSSDFFYGQNAPKVLILSPSLINYGFVCEWDDIDIVF